MKYFSNFSQKSEIDISCKLSGDLHETSNPVFWEKKISAKFAYRLVKI